MKKFIFNLQRFSQTVTTASQFASALSSGETDIIVAGSFSTSTQSNVTKNCKITIKSDCKITYTGGGRFIAVNSGVNFQLVNNGTITSSKQVNLIQNSGTTTVTGGGSIKCTDKGDTILNNSGATFINNGNTIYSKNNGTVLNKGTFKQTSGTLDSNNAGMYNEGTAYIYGGTVISGQMAIVNSKNLYVYGGTIGHNANTHGIYSSTTNARANIYGGTIYGKTWAVESKDGTITCNIYGGKFNNRIKGWFWIVGGEFKESAPTVNEGTTQKIGDYYVVYNTSKTSNSVCQVGSRYFASMQAAFDYANSQTNPTMTLLKNVELSETITLTKNLTLNLNGYNITRPSDASSDKIFVVNSGVTMTVKGNGTVENANNDVFKVNGGTLTLKSGTFKSTSNNAVWVNGGTLNVSGATLTSANSNAIHNGGTVTINSGTVSSTSSSQAAILNDSGKKVTVNNGTVSSTGSYAIQNNSGTLEVKGGTVKSTAKESVYTNGGTVNVSNGTVTSSKGSGIWSYNTGNITISGGVVSSTGSGNGVYLGNSSKITVSGNGKVYSTAGNGILTRACW